MKVEGSPQAVSQSLSPSGPAVFCKQKRGCAPTEKIRSLCARSSNSVVSLSARALIKPLAQPIVTACTCGSSLSVCVLCIERKEPRRYRGYAKISPPTELMSVWLIESKWFNARGTTNVGLIGCNGISVD